MLIIIILCATISAYINLVGLDEILSLIEQFFIVVGPKLGPYKSQTVNFSVRCEQHLIPCLKFQETSTIGNFVVKQS